MKYGFNNTSIVTGYIKELLKDFNLPTCKVYDPDKFEPNPIEIYKSFVKPIDIDRPYLCKNYFYIGNTGPTKLKKLDSFELGLDYPGITKNLVIKSNYYDQYTHEYLGDYLRFIRDYQGVNLMPLYNCYSGYWTTSVDKYFVKTSIRQKYNLTKTGEYRYYIFPVKFFEKYTISLSSDVPVEVFLMLGEDSDLNMEFIDGKKGLDGKFLFKSSLKKYHNLQKKNPKLYDTYEFSKEVSECYPSYWTHEENLKMVIKIPYWIDTSIAVLEGDYRINSSFLGETFFPKLPYEGEEIKPIEEIKLTELHDLEDEFDLFSQYFTKLSLLQNISNQSFPFADRLIEYLFNLPITKNNIIVNNVRRIQNKVYNRREYTGGFKGYSDVFDNYLRNNIYDISNQHIIFTKDGEYKVNKISHLQKPFTEDGLYWKSVYEDSDQILYSSLIDRESDILYWVDKDVEGLVDSL